MHSSVQILCFLTSVVTLIAIILTIITFYYTKKYVSQETVSKIPVLSHRVNLMYALISNCIERCNSICIPLFMHGMHLISLRVYYVTHLFNTSELM